MEGKTPHEIELAEAGGGLHTRLAQGLIDAAHYIAAHPELPIPSGVEIHYCIPAADDKAGDDEAYRIAGMLGTPTTGDDTSSEAHLSFGPVEYRAVYLTRDRMAAWYAASSYNGSVKPELSLVTS